MKNMKMAQKLFVGFGSVLLITCLLSYMALRLMDMAATDSDKVANKYLPELTGMATVDRNFSAALLAHSWATAHEDPQGFSTGLHYLEEANTALTDLQKLIDAHPDLRTLATLVPQMRATLDSYKNFATQASEKQHETLQLRHKMGRSVTTAFTQLQAVSSQIYKMIQEDLKQGNTDTAAIRVENLLRSESIMQEIRDIRIAIWQSQQLNDVKKLGEVLVKLDNLRSLMGTLNQNLITEAAKANTAGAVINLQHYSQNVREMISTWENLAETNKKSASAAEDARTILTEGVASISRIVTTQSINNLHHVQSQRQIFICVLTGALMVGLGLALLLTRLISRPLQQSMRFAQSVAAGNLDEKLEVTSRDEIGKLAEALRSMVNSLKTKINEAAAQAQTANKMSEEAKEATEAARLAQAAAETAKRDGMLSAAMQLEGIVEAVSSASSQLSSQVAQSDRGAATTSERLNETAAAMDEMNAAVLEVARNAGSAAQVSSEAKLKAQDGSGMVENMVTRIGGVEQQAQQLKDDMRQLGQQAEAIGSIMNVISDIADQTNLLALNAAIEAARAGEAGRGFAVVADEVRKLAEKTMQATVEVGTAIRQVQHGVEQNMKNVDASVGSIAEATSLARQAGDSLLEIVRLVDTSADQVRVIATAAEEQSSTSEEINRSLNLVSNAASESAMAMADASQAVLDLTQQAQRLTQLINDMKQG